MPTKMTRTVRRCSSKVLIVLRQIPAVNVHEFARQNPMNTLCAYTRRRSRRRINLSDTGETTSSAPPAAAAACAVAVPLIGSNLGIEHLTPLCGSAQTENVCM